jgi:SAM-dependent methyltransferase
MLPLDKQNAYRDRYKKLRPGWQTSGDEFEALTRRYITPTARVLDIGCGRGGVMELFWREARLTVGLDPEWASLHERRAPFPATCGRGEALPLASETFELVIALWVLEHLPDPGRVFAEAHRVLVPGGHFIFLTPNARHPLIWANRFSQAIPALQRLLIPKLYGRAEADTFRVRYRANTDAELHALAQQGPFQVGALRAISDPSYLAFTDGLFYWSVQLETRLPAGWGVHWLGDFVKRAFPGQWE